ncbi:MAG: glycine cleavage system protein GcvH [Tissierellia bacterium]|jgi:glycine cleavage system H protein|nr:glycine cleavage system protein GcvH [Tissierellia bacterium]MDD3226483.1 glycine cleavage system protein GcvH [Tissierellia bacterium]MDD3750808.1 glycine cleavage system protein GcvH [Tissierellia bacterium]MDD4045787.1 glycine cleavage system protein GcvH [Tissierellia bacterium]MDD4678383.1 glycine cleavage system protein GcvH [Tissierellia bacterium]
MKLLQELKYVESHEWVRVEENKAYVGITDYAQDQLGDIVYVEVPEVGTVVEAGDQFIVLESVKAASDVYAPVSGIVVEVNEELEDNPALINESAFDAWIVAIDMSMSNEIDSLLSAEEYEELCE